MGAGRLKITILGCGDSAGVPRIGGDWGNCDPSNLKNRRTRPSIMVQSKTTTLVIDTGPDFGFQLTRENVKKIDAVLYTHAHADHVTGIDDLRIIQGRVGNKIPIYLDSPTHQVLYERYQYIFKQTSNYYPAVVESNIFKESDFGSVLRIGDIDFIPFQQDHGQGNISLGFRFGDFGYSTDMRNLDDAAINVLRGIKNWIADCADYGHGQGTLHADFPTVQRLNGVIGAENVFLTHLKMFYDYDTLKAGLPSGYTPAYDGMVVPVTI
jgi:phosphoribosyl 1,2-cyclic phosphate phosphodiesterase